MSTYTFGHGMLAHWLLDPAEIYLNHGTVGVVPRRVLAAQQRIRDEIERHPSRFMLRRLAGHAGMPGPEPTLMRRAAAEVGAFVGAAAGFYSLYSHLVRKPDR